MSVKVNRALVALSAGLAVTSMTAVAQQKMPQTTKETVRGAGSSSTSQLRGTVEYVEGNHLVVRMANGEIRHFNPPEGRRFIVDGRELTVRDLKPGTRLTATITTTTTPVTDRTTTVGSGTVWWVAGTNVILTLPNGENRQYKVKDDYKFMVNGQPATVFDLRKGMRVSAEKIVEEPRVEIASDTTVTGQAPAAAVAQTTPPPAAPPAQREVAAARPAPAARTPAPEPTPAPAAPPAAPAAAPAKLPATASQLPLTVALGFLFTGAGLYLRRLGRSR